MKYFLVYSFSKKCDESGYGNMIIDEYDSLDDLKRELEFLLNGCKYKNKQLNYIIIKGTVLKDTIEEGI